MIRIYIFLIIFLVSSFGQSQNRIKYNEQDLFLNGVNLAWLSFSNDIGSGNTNLDEFAEILLDIHEHGGNSLRWWLHTNGSVTPEFNSSDLVIGPGEYTIQDLKSVLDLAWEREVGLKLCLWSFDMLRASLNTTYKDRNLLLLTDTTYTKSYIENAVIPMVDSLKGHPAIIAWEIFNEPEGMSDEFGWSEILHVPMSDIQRFINLTSAAIHKTDTSAQVTSGSWCFKAMTDVPTNSLSKLDEVSSEEKEEIMKFINRKYELSYTSSELFDHLSKVLKAENNNFYSDEALIAEGGDSLGILDFYSVHFYPALTSAYSPFEHSAVYWNLNKPIVIAEYGMVTGYGIPKDQLFNTLYQAGYAGSLPWAWSDTHFSSHEDMLNGMQSIWDNYQADVDVLGIGGDWPTISIVTPISKQKFSDTSSVKIEISAQDTDGTIVTVEIFANDTVKIAELYDAPYIFNWENVEPGNYNIHAIVTDNDGHTRKSSTINIVYGEPPYKRLEAEVVVIPNVGITISASTGASGGAYVEMRQTTTKIKWEFENLLSAGNYQIKFGYRLSFDSPKGQFINVNGTRITELMFDGDANKWLEKELFVSLIEGTNTIEIEPSWGWMDIDYLAIPNEIITSVNIEPVIHLNYALEQNYPNPFNPNTVINYTIAKNENVKLIVYDVLGSVVEELVNSKQQKGNYSIEYNGKYLSSGIYFYSLETESFIKQKKMILLK